MSTCKYLNTFVVHAAKIYMQINIGTYAFVYLQICTYILQGFNMFYFHFTISCSLICKTFSRWLFVYLYVYLSVCLYIYLSLYDCPSVCLSGFSVVCLLISLFHLILQHCNSYSSTWGNTKFIHIDRYVILYICLRTYVNVFALLHSCIVSLSPIIPHTQKLLCYSCETPFIFILFNMCCASFQVHLYIYFPFSFFCCFFLFFWMELLLLLLLPIYLILQNITLQ